MSTICVFLSLLAVSCGAFAQSVAPYDTPCALLGPDFPAPSSPSSGTAIRSAIRNATAALKAALTDPTIYGQLDPNTTSFSLSWYSTHEKDAFFNYDYSALSFAHPSEGVAIVDNNTIYALGSISKLFTVYAWLAAVGDVSFNEPVTKYVPELAAYAAKNVAALQSSDIDTFDWEDITIGALASQLDGLPRDFSLGPAFEAALQTDTGLPPFPPSNISYCGSLLQAEIPCNRSGTVIMNGAVDRTLSICLTLPTVSQCANISAGYLQDILSQHPTVAPFYTPVYSNAAFAILAFALENITGEPFSTTLDKQLIQPLHLNATSYFAPATNTSSFIPFNSTASWYGAAFRDDTPAGGYYSSVNDLQLLGISILNSTLLSPAQTRRWLKPHTFTATADAAVGAPWEIYLAPINRTSWMYTKAGNIGLYSSKLVLLPDYDAGFTVLAGGLKSGANVDIVSEIITAAFVPALEAAAKEEAEAVYTGTYGVAGTNLTVVTDEYPGLVISEWTANGTSVFEILSSLGLWGTVSPKTKFTARLYPTGLKSKDGTRVSFRAVYQALPQAQNPGVFSRTCVSWELVDNLAYGNVGADEFVFSLSRDGSKALSIEPRVLQSTLKKPTTGSKVMKRERMA